MLQGILHSKMLHMCKINAKNDILACPCSCFIHPGLCLFSANTVTHCEFQGMWRSFCTVCSPVLVCQKLAGIVQQAVHTVSIHTHRASHRSKELNAMKPSMLSEKMLCSGSGLCVPAADRCLWKLGEIWRLAFECLACLCCILCSKVPEESDETSSWVSSFQVFV